MGIVHEVSVAAGHVLQGIRAGATKLASHQLADGLPPAIAVSSIAFEAGAGLPISCSADGVGAPPPLSWQGVPESARSLFVICEDPDAPALEPFLHWLVFRLPGDADALDAQSQHDYPMGRNSRDEVGFTPAAPPPGHGIHHYHFQVFALDRLLNLEAGAERAAVLAEAKGHVLAWGEIVGTYQRE